MWIVIIAGVGYAAKVVVYATIGVLALLAAVRVFQHTAGTQGAFIVLLSQPCGSVLVGLLSVGLAAYALWRIVQGVMDTDRAGSNLRGIASRRTRTFIVRCAQVGHLARAVVFGIVGAFLIEAALHSDAREARGLGGALRELEQKPYGDWLLAAVAAGFLAYATYLVLLIVYRRISSNEDKRTVPLFRETRVRPR